MTRRPFATLFPAVWPERTLPSRAEALFQQLQSRQSLEALIGQPEDADFECKVWPDGKEAAKGSIVKAACGFANATGGVIILGVEASGRGQDTPDTVKGLRPVADTGAVASAALDFVLKYVEPGIQGIQISQVHEGEGSGDGYVLIYVPEQEDTPRRSKVDWKFYVRIASGTVPMEYFQIEDRFGRRPHPRLVVEIDEPKVSIPMGEDAPRRLVKVIVRNVGRGLAKLPALSVYERQNLHLYEGTYRTQPPLWPLLAQNSEWYSFRGGPTAFVYPGEKLLIAQFAQSASPVYDNWQFSSARLTAEVVCDGMAASKHEFEWDPIMRFDSDE